MKRFSSVVRLAPPTLVADRSLGSGTVAHFDQVAVLVESLGVGQLVVDLPLRNRNALIRLVDTLFHLNLD